MTLYIGNIATIFFRKKKNITLLTWIFRNIFSRIKKVLIIFSIFKKIFLKIDSLIYTLRTH